MTSESKYIDSHGFTGVFFTLDIKHRTMFILIELGKHNAHNRVDLPRIELNRVMLAYIQPGQFINHQLPSLYAFLTLSLSKWIVMIINSQTNWGKGDSPLNGVFMETQAKLMR